MYRTFSSLYTNRPRVYFYPFHFFPFRYFLSVCYKSSDGNLWYPEWISYAAGQTKPQPSIGVRVQLGKRRKKAGKEEIGYVLKCDKPCFVKGQVLYNKQNTTDRDNHQLITGRTHTHTHDVDSPKLWGEAGVHGQNHSSTSRTGRHNRLNINSVLH